MELVLVALCSFSIGVVYAGVLLSYAVIHCTLLQAPLKRETPGKRAFVTLVRLLLFGGVGLTLTIGRPLLQVSGGSSPLEPTLAIIAFLGTMFFGWKIIVPHVIGRPIKLAND
jgi:hypothetical protein